MYLTPIRFTAVAVTLTAAILTMYLLISIYTPQTAGPLGVTVFIILLFVAILSTLTLVKMIFLRTSKVSLRGLVGLALIPTISIALNSLRQLSVVDIVLIVIFAALVNLYIKKAVSTPSNS